MANVFYRKASAQDVSFLAEIRGAQSGQVTAWKSRILEYLAGTHHPQQALGQRIIYVACIDENIIGFVAGHLTRRFHCDGELQWIDVVAEYRRRGVASELVRLLVDWFVQQKSFKICVDPGNKAARNFYRHLGAESFNDRWMYWKDIRGMSRPIQE